MATPVVEHPPITTAAPVPAAAESKVPRRERAQWSRLVTGPYPLLCILAVQAVLSLRLVRARTAFGDEALYLYAGHLEWAHWLHGTPIPAFPTWFSGAPVIYPPIGALADSIGGLVAARILSLCFMLGTTVLLWATASRLYGRRAAFFSAALFAALGPTLHLGAFATYDAMALFFLAAAMWCATAARTREDATAWILASAALLALANATKYASALFDPTVIIAAVLAAYPRPGGKAALRRGALLAACATGLIAGLIRLGGPWYVGGISETTTGRVSSNAHVWRVLLDSAQWIGMAIILSLAAVAICVITRKRRPVVLLTAVLTVTALLVPAEQARIRTTVSLNKHVDFGAWFAIIAAGYAVSQIVTLLRSRHARIIATAALAGCLLPLMASGMAQARQMVNWPGAVNLIRFIRPLTTHGGHFLAETDDVPEYYLPDTSWRQWSNTFSITLPNGLVQNENGNPQPYAEAIRAHYFSLIILEFDESPVMDQNIIRDLRADPAYRLIGMVNFEGPGPHVYLVYAYRPHGGGR